MSTFRKKKTRASEEPPSRPLGEAFKTHRMMPNVHDEQLLFAEFTAQRGILLRREAVFAGGPQSNPLTFLNAITSGRAVFTELKKCGIAIPHFSYVIAEHSEGKKPCLFTVIERVEGENVTDIAILNADLLLEVERVFIVMLSHLRRARQTGSTFWTDFNIHQFMYGTLERDLVSRLYLVDVEPYVGKWPALCSSMGQDQEIATRSYIMQLMRIFTDISGFEERCGQHIRFRKARKQLKRCVAETIPALPYAEFRENLLQLLR